MGTNQRYGSISNVGGTQMDGIIKDLNKLAVSYEVAANKLGKINKEYFDHDCTLSAEDGCEACEKIWDQETDVLGRRFQAGHGLTADDYHPEMKIKTKCCGDDESNGQCLNCGAPAEMERMACWRKNDN